MKKLIVLATLAALPAVALADVTISGDIGVAIVNTKHHDSGIFADKTSVNSMERQTGQIVFSGSDNLGNGLKAIWQVANRIDGSGNEQDNAWSGRDTFVGLEGNLGKLRIGHLSTTTNSGYERPEVFAHIAIDGDGIGALGEARTANTIRYDSPNYGGFEFAASAELAPENQADGFGGQAAPHTSSLGLKYATGPLSLVYSYVNYKDTFSGLNPELNNLWFGTDEGVAEESAKTRVHTAKAEYAAGDLTVGVGYVQAKSSDPFGWVKERGYGVYGSYKLGQLTPKLSYWKEGALKSDFGQVMGGFSVLSVGADYALSKRTSAGVELQFQGARKLTGTSDKYGKKNTSAVYLTHAF